MTHLISHWWWWFTGARNEAGSTYGLWSGFGGAVPDVMILAAMVGYLAHHNCEVRKCWRLKRHTTAAGHVVCRVHAPGGAPTHEEVIAAHEAAKPKPRTRAVKP